MYDKSLEASFTFFRDIDKIIEELLFAKDAGFEFICFNDSFLMANRKYLLELFKRYKREISLPFLAQLFPSQVLKERDLLDTAYAAGLRNCTVGIQSGSERVCREVFNRPMKTEEIIEFSRALSSYEEMEYSYHLLTHNPFETDEDYEHTFSLISRLPKKNSVLQMGRLFPFKGTKIYEDIANKNPKGADNATHYQRTLLSLLRYEIEDDSKFRELQAKMGKLDIQDSINIYEQEMAGNEISDDRQYPVQFLSNHGKYNIILAGNRVLGVDQSLAMGTHEMMDAAIIDKFSKQGRLIVRRSITQVMEAIDNR